MGKHIQPRRRKRRKTSRRRLVFLFAVLIALAACLVAFRDGFLPGGAALPPDEPADAAPYIAQQPESDTAPPAADEEPQYLSLVAVGDNLIHNTVFEAARTEGGFDFLPFYESIRPYIETADIAVVNQESPLGGPDYRPSGYPAFNSPQQVGLDLMEIGFNVISHANNHAMDRAAGCVDDTIEFWRRFEAEGILLTGIYMDAEDRARLRVMEKNGIRVGFLAYTYGTNGIDLPKDRPDLVALIEKEIIKAEMEKLAEMCDLTVVIMHWGNEYTHKPTEEQEDLAEYLTELGAGLIIGHHPHVVQPAGWIESENGNRAFCVYSLGNFVSSQERPATMLEGMLQLTIKKAPDGEVSLVNPGIMAMVNHYNDKRKNYHVYPLSEYTETLAGSHFVRSKGNVSVAAMEKIAADVFGEYLTRGSFPVPYSGGGQT